MQHSDAAHIHIGNELTQQRDSKSVEFGGGGGGVAGGVRSPSAALPAVWPVNHLAISSSCQAHFDVTFNWSALMRDGVAWSTPRTHASLWQMYILQMKPWYRRLRFTM